MMKLVPLGGGIKLPTRAVPVGLSGDRRRDFTRRADTQSDL